MTNEERRRASGAAMEASRRGSGAAMEASRRASGAAMTARRTGKSVADDIQSLTAPQRQAKPLPRIDPVGPLPAQRGRGTSPAPVASGGGGGGIASPLTEKTRAENGKQVPDRDYYPEALLPTTDGLVWARWRGVKTIRMTDANGETVVMEYGNDLSE
jgi:hypothetical protein